MSDDDALLAAVWADPHADLPRLAYADWLDDRGTPEQTARAELIRVQCELARLDAADPPEPGRELMAGWGRTQFPAVPVAPKRAALLARAARLKVNAKAWKAGVPKPLANAPYHRGFLRPAYKGKTLSKLAAMPAELLAAAPLWEFSLGSPPVARAQTAARPALARCWRLRTVLDQPFARRLADGYVPHLAELAFSAFQGELRPDALPDLLSSPHLPHLTVVDARYAALPPGSVAAALARPGPPLRSLGLFGTRLTDADVTTILTAPRCAGLRELDLGQNREVTASVWGTLPAAPCLPKLAFLELDNNPSVGDGFAVALAATPHARNLRVLRLHRTGLSEQGAAALAASPHLGGLIELLLSRAAVGRQEVALRERFGDRLLLA